MKKILFVLAALVAFVGFAVAGGSQYDRATKTLKLTAGTWTNSDYDYSSIALDRIWIEGSAVAIDTVTVQRVTSDGTWTQACASIVLAANKGNSATFTAGYLKQGDKLLFSSFVGAGTGTNTAIIDYHVERLAP